MKEGNMKIALSGYGKMGMMVEYAATARGHQIVAKIDPFAASATYKKVCKEALDGADAMIEFSNPEAAVGNIEAALANKTPVVVGTTGWYQNLKRVEKAVAESGVALVYGTNYSVGVQLFYKIVAEAARLMNEFPEYDVGGFEIHHNRKLDAPSGTAKTMAGIIMENLKRKTSLVTDLESRKPLPEEMQVGSLRVGFVPGTHTVVFDSEADTIELTHRARNREGLALGAVRAAEWLTREQRRGVFTVEDVFAEL
jgi:4-hydroxy-tetrahydrodipicolinate reductase